MPYTNPTAGDVHVNRPLTNFSQKYLQNADAFVAMRAFPNLPVSMQSDLYYEFDRGDFYRDEAAERADGTETQGGGFNLSTSPYFARVYGFHKLVTDRQRSNADPGVNLDESATQFVTHKLLIRRERAMISNLFSTTSGWTGSSTGGNITTVNWGTGDPITQIRSEKRSVQEKTGYRPNKMMIGRTGYDALLDNDEVLARITGGSNNNLPAIVMRQLLAQLFELDEIFVIDAVYNTALEGATDSFDFVSGDNALLYYAPNSVGLNEPTAAVQFSWTGLLGNTPAGMRIRRFREEGKAGDKVEGDMAFDFKLTGADLGVFFTGVSS